MSIKGLKKTENAIYFFGGQSVFSNFYVGDNTNFEHHGINFICGEHAYVWEKATYFGDTEILDILTNYPSDKPISYMKHLSYKIKGFDELEWDKVKYNKMVSVITSKFSSHKLRYKILNTENKLLVEASKDSIWGIGVALNSKYLEDTSKWKGSNLLGKALMEVRENIRNSLEE